MLWDNFKLEVRDKTIDQCCKKLANRKKMKLKNRKMKYLEELSNTSTYKEDTSLKQKLEIIIKRLDKLHTEKTKGKQMDRRRRKQYSFFLGARKHKTNKKGYK